MGDHIWRCPHCIREIDLSDPAGNIAKNSHEKSHQIPTSGPRHAKPSGKSGGWFGWIEDILDGLSD